MRILRKAIKILPLFIISIFLFSCNTTTTTTSEYLDVDYDDFNGQFIEVPDEQLSMPQDDYYIYYYGQSCQGCILIKDQVLDTFFRAKNTTIYFVSVNSIYDIDPNSGVSVTPTVVRVQNNQVTEIYEAGDEIIPMLKDIT